MTKELQNLNMSIRSITISLDALGYASASVLLSQGNTKVLACVSLQPGVPSFLKGQGTGWLTAEYAMLPCATQQRTQRESNANQRNSRSVEISRLIGRCLRISVDLSKLKEKTVLVDCEVLQADGGTRVACLTAASLALEIAYYRWYLKGIVDLGFFKERLAAISVGFVNNQPCIDLSYAEDSLAQSDFNIVMTRSMKLVEIQGTAEKELLSFKDFDILKDIAQDGIVQLFDCVDTNLTTNAMYQELLNNFNNKTTEASNAPLRQNAKNTSSMFSLGNRFNHTKS